MMMTIETDPGWPRTMPLTVRHSQVVTSHDTEPSLHESVVCYKTRPDLKFASMRACCATAKHIDAGHGMRQENWQVPRRQANERSVGSAGNSVVT